MNISPTHPGTPHGDGLALAAVHAASQRPRPAEAVEADARGIDAGSNEEGLPPPIGSVSMPTAEQLKFLRYQGMAVAVRRLIGGAAMKAIFLFLGLACLFGGGHPVGAAEPPAPREHQLKAAYLFNFTKFIEWPAQSFADAKAPIVIGIFGKSGLGAELENAVKDRQVNGRSFVVKQLEQPAAAKQVHLLFVCGDETARFAEIKECLKKTSVVTVGETDAFARQGGMIKFVVEGDKLRFDINTDSADQAGIKLSAQLLKLARTVHQKP